MAEPLLFDARIEELLRELAADPKSSLLRVPRPARLGVVLERKPLVGVATAGLTLAERELVRAHREELAYLLRRLAVVRLFESPKAATSRPRTCISRQPAVDLDKSRWIKEAQQLAAEGLPDEPLPSSPEGLLLSLVRAEGLSDSVSVVAIAAAANQLAPTDQARIYAAQWLGGDEDDWHGAKQILLSVMASSPANQHASLAATNIARYEYLSGSALSANRWYREAVRLFRLNAVAAFSWLTSALDCGDSTDIATASQFVDEQFAVDDPATTDFIQLMKSQREAGEATPSRASYAAAHSIVDDCRGSAKAIAEVYLDER